MTNLKTLLFAVLLSAAGLAATVSAAGDSTKWTVQDFPVTEGITGVHFYSMDSGYAVTNGGVIARTFDGGNKWIGRRITDTPLEDLQFINGPIGWVVGRSGLIWKTVDGGLNWENQSYKDTAAWMLDIYMFDRDTGLVIGAARQDREKLGGLMLRTTDGGKNWKELEIGGLGYSEFSCVDNKTIHFLSYGAIFTSYDQGSTWERTLTLDGSPCRCLSIVGSSGIMGGSSGTLAYSRDGGKTWIKMPQDKKDLFVACRMITQTLGYMGGQDGLFKKTQNGGSMWEDEDLPVSFDIYDMQLIGPKLYLVGSNGTVVVGDIFDRARKTLVEPGKSLRKTSD